MTDKKTEALKLALEALEDYVEEYGPHEKDSGAAYAITAIKEALADQPAQQHDIPKIGCVNHDCDKCKAQQQELQELTAQRDQLADILTRTANALKGEPAELSLHSWHDLPEVAQQLRAAQQQEPVAWMPIEQMYPQAKAIDILMGDGSILCAVLPQFDGDLWWEGSGTGEKFIDPKYANVTHWRIHDERTSTPATKPWVGLTEQERNDLEDYCEMIIGKAAFEAIEAKLKEKNG